MKVLVCDDEPLARERLKRLIEKQEGYTVIGEAVNGIEAVESCRQLKPDILVIDIQMPRIDGLEAASHISRFDEAPAIIFCTAYDAYAIEAFTVNAIAYLLKPVKSEKLLQALKNCHKINKAQLSLVADNFAKHEGKPNKRSHISTKTHRGIELIPISDILYFKADQKYVSIRHVNGKTLVDDTLKDFETDLGEHFVRIHRNALVAVQYIEGLEMLSAGHYRVRIKGVDESLQVSRRHASTLRKLLHTL